MSNLHKYPRTWHLPTSRTVTKDDHDFPDDAEEATFSGHRVIVTEKLDGENTSFYHDSIWDAEKVAACYTKENFDACCA